MANVLDQKPALSPMLPFHHDQVQDEDRPPCYRRPRRNIFYSLLLVGTLVYAASQTTWRSYLPSAHSGDAEAILVSDAHCGSRSCARNPSWLIKAKHGAVASENEICSNIGVDTLKKGGNAVDAAIATTLCIGVVNMFS